jgi:hypothetical protein
MSKALYPASEARKQFQFKAKQLVLKQDLTKVERLAHKAGYFGNVKNSWKVLDDGRLVRVKIRCADVDKQSEYWFLRESNHLIGYAHRLNKAKDARTMRLRDRCTTAINSGKAVFLTLSFSPETLAKTSAKTRRVYVTRFLKKVSPEFYVANIDFGGEGEYIDRKGKKRVKTSREHYHCLVLHRVNFKRDWPYATNNECQPVHASKKSDRAIPKYIAKLTNHAIKESARGVRIVYSRGA